MRKVTYLITCTTIIAALFSCSKSEKFQEAQKISQQIVTIQQQILSENQRQPAQLPLIRVEANNKIREMNNETYMRP